MKKNEEAVQELKTSNEAIFYVNGVRKVLPDGLAHLTLLEYLRGIIATSQAVSYIQGLDLELKELNSFLHFWPSYFSV